MRNIRLLLVLLAFVCSSAFAGMTTHRLGEIYKSCKKSMPGVSEEGGRRVIKINLRSGEQIVLISPGRGRPFCNVGSWIVDQDPTGRIAGEDNEINQEALGHLLNGQVVGGFVLEGVVLPSDDGGSAAAEPEEGGVGNQIIAYYLALQGAPTGDTGDQPGVGDGEGDGEHGGEQAIVDDTASSGSATTASVKPNCISGDDLIIIFDNNISKFFVDKRVIIRFKNNTTGVVLVIEFEDVADNGEWYRITGDTQGFVNDATGEVNLVALQGLLQGANLNYTLIPPTGAAEENYTTEDGQTGGSGNLAQMNVGNMGAIEEAFIEAGDSEEAVGGGPPSGGPPSGDGAENRAEISPPPSSPVLGNLTAPSGRNDTDIDISVPWSPFKIIAGILRDPPSPDGGSGSGDFYY